jgi:hypothetical protein
MPVMLARGRRLTYNLRRLVTSQLAPHTALTRQIIPYPFLSAPAFLSHSIVTALLWGILFCITLPLVIYFPIDIG